MGSARTIVTPYPHSEQWNSPLTRSPAALNSTYSSDTTRDVSRPSVIQTPIEYPLRRESISPPSAWRQKPCKLQSLIPHQNRQRTIG